MTENQEALLNGDIVENVIEQTDSLSSKEFVDQILYKSFRLQDISQLIKSIEKTTFYLKNLKNLFFDFKDLCAFYFALTNEAIVDPYFFELNNCLSKFYSELCQTCFHCGIQEKKKNDNAWICLIEKTCEKFGLTLSTLDEDNVIIVETVPLALNSLLIIGITFYPLDYLEKLFDSLFFIINNRIERKLNVSLKSWDELLNNLDQCIMIYSSINLANRFEEEDLRKFTIFLIENALKHRNPFSQHLTMKAVKDLSLTLRISSRELFMFFQKEISDSLIKLINCDFESNYRVLYDCMKFFSISSLPYELLKWIIPTFAVKRNNQTRLLFDEIQKNQKPAFFPIKLHLVDILVYIFYELKGDVKLIYEVFLYLTEYFNTNVFTYLFEISNAFTEAFFHRISLDHAATLRGLSFVVDAKTSVSKIDPEKLDAILDVSLDMFTSDKKKFVNFLQYHFPVYIHRIDPKILFNSYTITEKLIMVQSFNEILKHFDSQFINRFRVKIFFTIRLLLSERHHSNRALLKIGLNILIYFIENVEKEFLQCELLSICLLIVPLVQLLPDDSIKVFEKLLFLHQYPTTLYYQLYIIPEMPVLKSVKELILQKINAVSATPVLELNVQLVEYNELINYVKSEDFLTKCRMIYSLLLNINSDNEKLQEVLLRSLYTLLESNKELFYNLYSIKSDYYLNEELSDIVINLQFVPSNESATMTISELFRHIIIKLLLCLKFSTNTEVRNQSANCLGLLGAIDSKFLHFETPFSNEMFTTHRLANSVDYCDQKVFSSNKKQFKMLLLEILMNTVKASTKNFDYNSASYAMQELLKLFTSEQCLPLIDSGNFSTNCNTQQMDVAIENYIVQQLTQAEDPGVDEKKLSKFDQIKQVLQNENVEILNSSVDLTGELLSYSKMLELCEYTSKKFDHQELTPMEDFFNSFKPTMSYWDFIKRFLHMLYHSFLVYHEKQAEINQNYGEIFSQQFSSDQSQRCMSQYQQEWNCIVTKLCALKTPKQIFIVCYHLVFRNIKLAYFLLPGLLLLCLGLGTDSMRVQFSKQFKLLVEKVFNDKLIFNNELGLMVTELICFIYDYLNQWYRNRKIAHQILIKRIFIRNRSRRFDKEFDAVTLILESLSYMDVAKLAYEAKYYHKALLYIEMSYNDIHQNSVSPVALNSFLEENCDFLNKIYCGLNDLGSLKGLSSVRGRLMPSVDHLYHTHIVQKDPVEQLICGSKLLLSSSCKSNEICKLKNFDYQEKYFNSLIQINQDLSNFSSIDTLKELKRWTPNIAYYVMESAWRLSSWKQIDELFTTHITNPYFGDTSDVNSNLISPSIGLVLSSMFAREALFNLEHKITDIRSNFLSSLNASSLSNINTSYSRSYQSCIVQLHIMHDIQHFASTVYNCLLNVEDVTDLPSSFSQFKEIFSDLISHWRLRNRILPVGYARQQVIDVQRALIHLLKDVQNKKFVDNCVQVELFRYWNDSLRHSIEFCAMDKAYIALLELIDLEHSFEKDEFSKLFTESEQIDYRIDAANVFWAKNNRSGMIMRLIRFFLIKKCFFLLESLKILKSELENHFSEVKRFCYMETLKNLPQLNESDLLDISNSLSIKLPKSCFTQISGSSSSRLPSSAGGVSYRINSASNQSPVTSESLLDLATNAELKRFARLQLTYADYCDDAKVFNANTMIMMYKAVTIACPQWEDGHFHIAMFYRRLLKEYQNASLLLASQTSYSIGKPDEIGDLKARVIKSLCDSLKYGTFKKVSVSLPTLINTWLDLGSEYLASERKAQNPTPQDSRTAILLKDLLRRFIERSTANVRLLASSVNNAIFFIVIDILIGHILHQHDPIAKTIEDILVKMIADFPHHMAWKFSRSINSNGRRGLVSKDFVFNAAKSSPSNSYLNRYFENFRFFSTCINELARYKPPKSTNISNRGSSFASKNELTLSKVCPNLIRSLTTLNNYKFAVPSKKFFMPTALNMERISSKETFDQHFGCLFIEKLENNAQIMKSLQMPKKLTFICTDGKKKIILCKCMDDLRKDQCMLNFCNLFNQCYRKEIPSIDSMASFDEQLDAYSEMKIWSDRKQNPLSVQTYFVAPLSDSFGVIEWINDLRSMKSLIEAQYMRNRLSKKKYETSRLLFIKSVYSSSLTREKRIERFLTSYPSFQPSVFQNWFYEYYADSFSWYLARSNFTKSSAIYSILGYALGLGDRHAENILLEPSTGQVVQVDFNCLFNRGEEFQVPECVPFRLTHNMISAMGTLGFEGTFRHTAEDVLLILRQYRELFSSNVTIFQYDMLTEWLESSNRVELVKSFAIYFFKFFSIK